ncbi:MAG: hypothetical protein M1818_007646 [Claussenomyces sp. TS43310]|nr:MAG: hypothetical protein M1818_007646 [Claussenomyces sp. TS43310]
MFSRSRSRSKSSSHGKSSGSSKTGGSSSSSSGGSASRRLLQELSGWRKDLARNPTEFPAIERLGPVDDDDLFHWEAVINGRRLGGGYDGGRWLLDIRIPDGKGNTSAAAKTSSGKKDGPKEGAYPLAPPVVRFVTRICAPNVDFETGEVCLDLLKTAWTPAYTLPMTVDAIWQMLDAPEVDSPLNVDIAALLRDGDRIGAEGVVRWCCGEWRYDGR